MVAEAARSGARIENADRRCSSYQHPNGNEVERSQNREHLPPLTSLIALLSHEDAAVQRIDAPCTPAVAVSIKPARRLPIRASLLERVERQVRWSDVETRPTTMCCESIDDERRT